MRALLVIVGLLAPAWSQAEKLAITFDDLPLNGTLAPGVDRVRIATEVVALLQRAGVPPVYGFVNGQRMESHPDAAAALEVWTAAGERVGNHSYSHPDLNDLTAAQFLADVRRNEPLLQQLAPGDASWKWFRYPYLREGDSLAKRRAVRRALADRGYRIAQVTIDYEDYLWNSPYARCLARDDRAAILWLKSSYLALASAYIEADRRMAQLVFGHPINHVLLLHLGAFSSTILPALLPLLHEQGFTLVSLEEAESDPAYELDPDAASKHGGTLLEQALDARHLAHPLVPEKPYQKLDSMCP